MEASSPRARRRRSIYVLAPAIAVLVALIGATVLQFQRSGGAAPSSTTTSGPVLKGAGKELLALLERDSHAVFHATYDVSAPDLGGAAVRYETWRRPPRTRSDIEVRKTDGIVHTRQLVLADKTVACQANDDAPWQCSTVPAAAGAAGDPFTQTITAEVAKASSVTVKSETIDGRRVRCFTLVRAGESARFCATAAGIPVRVESTGATLRLLSLSRRVGDVFQPPAEVR